MAADRRETNRIARPDIVQGEGDQSVGESFVVPVSAPGRDHNILLSGRPAQIGHGNGVSAGVDSGNPEFFSSVFVESPESAVVAVPDKYQPAGS